MNAQVDSASPAPVPKRSRWLRKSVLCAGLVVALAVWFFREPLRSRIAEKATLMNDAPPPEAVEEMIQKAPDPIAAVLAAWNSGKIVHRQVAIRQLLHIVRREHASPELRTLLRSAALDPDMNVREAALAGLQTWDDRALTALAAAQITDHDPQVRMLGLQYLKYAPAEVGVPSIVPLLDDADPFFLTMSLKLLEKWSGQDFGVKLVDTAPVENEKTGLKEFRKGSHAKAKAGAERAKEWWSKHQAEFKPVHLHVPAEALAAMKPVASPDFSLKRLDGRRVRLSDFRGKVVLINFWTTWCTACVSEMPELIELQKRYAERLAILGVSLDYVPDSHGHIGGHAAVEEQNHSDGHHDDKERKAAAEKRVREKIARTVKTRGINYTILLDEHNTVGGRFNGGELPTTVIVDAEGYVRRRFVGARSLPVFEAMIAEAKLPFAAGVRR